MCSYGVEQVCMGVGSALAACTGRGLLLAPRRGALGGRAAGAPKCRARGAATGTPRQAKREGLFIEH